MNYSRQYGPVYIWGDIESDELIKPETIDRHTVDENVNFIAEEYDKAIAELPAEISDFKNGQDVSPRERQWLPKRAYCSMPPVRCIMDAIFIKDK
ncbi:hypothetical protein NXV44_00155 [Bacteroides thetaiotaomicron]|nr:hypothetical protein [Bacteroides thetaiotaomicron]